MEAATQSTLPQTIWKIIGAVLVLVVANKIMKFLLARTAQETPAPVPPTTGPRQSTPPTTTTPVKTASPVPNRDQPQTSFYTNNPSARHAELQARKQALLEAARKKFLDKSTKTETTQPATEAKTSPVSPPVQTVAETELTSITQTTTSTQQEAVPTTPTKSPNPSSTTSTPSTPPSTPLSSSTSRSNPSSPLSNSASPSSSAKKRKQGLDLSTGELKDVSEVVVEEVDKAEQRRRALQALQRRLEVTDTL